MAQVAPFDGAMRVYCILHVTDYQTTHCFSKQVHVTNTFLNVNLGNLGGSQLFERYLIVILAFESSIRAHYCRDRQLFWPAVKGNMKPIFQRYILFVSKVSQWQHDDRKLIMHHATDIKSVKCGAAYQYRRQLHLVEHSSPTTNNSKRLIVMERIHKRKK